MKLKKIVSTLLASAMVAAVIPVLHAEESAETVKLNPSAASPFGEFDGWGTSLCWWANYIGYNDELTNKTAKAFFNADEGLGLNIARYNIGGGDGAHTHMINNRPDGAMPGLASGTDENGNIIWDWDADANQVNVLKAAIREGADNIEAFANSAPYFMTVSGCSSGGYHTATQAELDAYAENQKKAEKDRVQYFDVDTAENITMTTLDGHEHIGIPDASVDNIAADQYEHFADYLTDVVTHFEEQGIHFDSLSPFNEPGSNYWAYGSTKQEGMHVSPGTAQSAIVNAVKSSMTEKGIDILLTGTEENDIKDGRNNFNALDTQAKAALDRINVHSYSGDVRDSLKTTASENGKQLWMSEVDGKFRAGTNAGSMTPALGLAGRINADVNQMMPTAWVMWQVIDRHKKADTIYANNPLVPEDGGYWGTAFADHDTNELVLTKKYYGFGQYSRYIRPGYTIIGNSDTNNMLTAYDKDSGKIVIVASNTSDKAKNYQFDLTAFGNVGSTVQSVRTSQTETWQDIGNIQTQAKTFAAELAPNSITTFIVTPDITQYKLTFQNESGAVLGAERLEKTGTGSYRILNENGQALKADLTFGEYAQGDDWILEEHTDYYAVKNADGEYLSMTQQNELSVGGTTDLKWTITPVFDVNFLTVTSDKLLVVTGQTAQFTTVFDPDTVENKAVVWSVKEKDGMTDTTKAVIDANGQLTAREPGEVVIMAESEAYPNVCGIYRLTILGEDSYITIQNKNSKKILDIQDRSMEENARLVQWTDLNYASQQWNLQFVEGDYFHIVNRKSGKMLAGGSGSEIIQKEIDAADISGQWLVQQRTDGYYKIVNRKTEKSMDVSEGKTDDGVFIIQYTDNGGDNQAWTIAVCEENPAAEPMKLSPVSGQKKLSGTPFGTEKGSETWERDYTNVFDGDIGTVMDINVPTDVVAGMDLGEGNESRVGKIRYVPRTSKDTGSKHYALRVRGGKFQGSNDGKTYEDIYTIPMDYTPVQNAFNTVIVNTDKAYRYLRYLAPENSYGNIAEVEFYSDGVTIDGAVSLNADKMLDIDVTGSGMDPSAAYLFAVGLYDGQGMLKDIVYQDILTDNEGNFMVKLEKGAENAKTAKAFIWERTELNPITYSETLSIQ